MNKELKYNGHTASPADYECPDGDLSVSMDLWPENGSLRPVLQPKDILQLEAGQKVMYLHETSSFSHYIVYDSGKNTLFWVDKDSTEQTSMSVSGLTAGSLTSVSGIGNTVIVFTTSGMRYYLWKDKNYSYLGTDIPDISLSFGLQGKVETADEIFTISFAEEIAAADIYKELSDDNKGRITEQVLAKVNKFIAEHSTNAGKFIFPFFVRYAYRLYDGSLTRHSAPVLMVCSSDLAPQAIVAAFQGSNNIYNAAEIGIGAMVHQLDYACTSASDIDALKNWKDIVNSVDIFVSAPIYTYDQSGECSQFSATGEGQNDSFSICKQTDSTTSPKYAYYQYNTFGKMYAFAFNPSTLYSPTARLMLPRKSSSAIKEAIKSCSSFYLLEKIKVEDLTALRTVIEVEEDYLQSLVNREVMTDDYDSHDKLIPNYSFTYNSRLNLADLKKRLFDGFSVAGAFCKFDTSYAGIESGKIVTNSDAFTAVCYVHINQGGKDIIVKGGNGTFGHNAKLLFFYYPNINAYKVTIAVYDSSSELKTVYSAKLEQHNFLNGAFYFEGWDGPSAGGSVPAVSTDEEKAVSLPNKLYTSEVNNPFLFPVTSINTIGTGRIIAVSTAAKALSQGQFGQFPLYAFTTDGVWALEVSSTTGGYSAKQPITRDVCLGDESVAQIDSAVLFATDRGIMLIAGSETKCVSDVLDNGTDTAFSLESLPQAGDVLIGAGKTDAAFSFVPFRTFLAGCRMLYDYESQRLIVYNPAYSYAYVYSMKMKQWGMMRSDIASGVNSYPECLAMTSDNRLVDFAQRIPNTTPKNQVLVTRPLKLDAPDILKTVSSVIQRGNFKKGEVKVLLYGSRDLLNWFPVSSSSDHYLRGFRGTPYKYFRLALKCSLADNESINGCSIVFDTRLVGQPR